MTKTRFKNFFDSIYYGLTAGNERKEFSCGLEYFFNWLEGILMLLIWFLSVVYFSTISVGGAITFQFILGCLFLALLIISEQQSDAWKKCLVAWTQPETKKQQKESEIKYENLSKKKKLIAISIFGYILTSTIIIAIITIL